MPTYLCYGFRWDRRAIRIFVANHDLEDATPDWVINKRSSMVILRQLHKLYPSIRKPDEPVDLQGRDALEQEVNPEYGHLPANYNPEDDLVLCHDWSAIKLLESHDGTNREASRPYAFVANYVVRVDQDCNLSIESAYKALLTEKHETEHGYLRTLQGALAPGEPLAWHVVHCADSERAT